MTTIVGVFAEAAQAHAAADHLHAAGRPSDRVKVHENVATARNAGALETDELLTGGFFSNFGALLDGLLDHPRPSGEAATYDEVVRSQATFVSAETESAADADACAAELRSLGATTVRRMPRAGDEGGGQTTG